MSKEIIAYRIGDHFLCPKHYQMSVKILSVHNIELPAQPVIDGEIESFVCNQCEDIDKPINGDEGGKVVYLQEKINRTGLLNKVESELKDFIESEKHRDTEIDMIRQIVKISRRAKFAQKTLHLACEGRPLSRKNIATFRNFFDDLGEKLPRLREMITIDVLTSMDYRQILAEQARRNFCALSPEDQKILREEFVIRLKYRQEQEHLREEEVRY